MPNPELVKYITTLRQQLVNDNTIKNTLLSSGWPEDEVLGALIPQVPLPPAPKKTRFSMWITFQYTIEFITLYIWATAFGGIIHFAIDKNFPDQLKALSYSSMIGSYVMPGYLSAIIVSYPIFAFLLFILKKQERQNPEIKNIRTRKVLIYFTLIVAFLILVSQLISGVFSFLNGSASLNSFMHILATFLIAGSIFLCLLFSVWDDRKEHA